MVPGIVLPALDLVPPGHQQPPHPLVVLEQPLVTSRVHIDLEGPDRRVPHQVPDHKMGKNLASTTGIRSLTLVNVLADRIHSFCP